MRCGNLDSERSGYGEITVEADVALPEQYRLHQALDGLVAIVRGESHKSRVAPRGVLAIWRWDPDTQAVPGYNNLIRKLRRTFQLALACDWHEPRGRQP